MSSLTSALFPCFLPAVAWKAGPEWRVARARRKAMVLTVTAARKASVAFKIDLAPTARMASVMWRAGPVWMWR